jgi:hypothetical protein
MNRVISLLEEKNHYLEKFVAVNENALELFQLGNFDSVEEFYETRERILEIIKYLDEELIKQEAQNNSDELKQIISENLAIKDQYVDFILSQDLEILSCIDLAKSAIIRELQDVKKARKAVSGYKSQKRDPNQRLDEEA